MVILPSEKGLDWRHPPTVLIGLVVVNILVFFLYQSGDSLKIQKAYTTYEQRQLFETEWPIYQAYLLDNSRQETLEQYRDNLEQGFRGDVVFALLMDYQFNQYINNNYRQLISNAEASNWRNQRLAINDYLDSISFTQLGLIPDRLNPVNLLTYQFLHGDMLHLLSNLFFLVICGFAVEAAIGHWRFLLFYLIAGIAGGLCHALVNLNSSMSLVGASGAISGVMAMYLGVFRLRKIEFFYWFFVFVGYFRAPALLILPFYIGKELFDYYSNPDSNVAFMAHAGGFAAGAVLMIGSYLINPKLINQTYVEEDQESDPHRGELARIYQYIENYHFGSARKAVEALIEKEGLTFELAVLRYNLLKINKPETFYSALENLLQLSPQAPRHQHQQSCAWQENPDSHSRFQDDLLIKLALGLADKVHFATAESVFKELHRRQSTHPQMKRLANRLSQVAGVVGDTGKQKRYQELATGSV